MPLEHVSHSALDQYLRCSWQYKLERIDGLAVAPAWFFIGGSAVHLATARMDTTNTYPYTDDQLEYIWSQAFNELIHEAYQKWPADKQWRQAGRPSKTWPDGQRYKYWNERGIAAVKSWQRWRMLTSDVYPVVAIEYPIEYTLPSGIRVKGIIDRVHAHTSSESMLTRIFPLDIKSGTKRPQSPMQLALYRQGLITNFPEVEVTDQGAWWMAKDAEAFFIEVGHIGLTEIDAYAQAYVRGVENEVFIPNVGDACFMCPFTRQCFAKEQQP